MDPKPIANLLPRELVDLARARTEDAFMDAVGVPLLLVRIDDPHGELALGLAQAPTADGGLILPTISYGTVAARLPAFGTVAPISFGPAQVLARLQRAVNVAVPLRKRVTGKSYTDRISVGRATNNDVVFRHASVSKSHAYFECDDEDLFYVTDANSTNTTRLGGQPVRPTQATPVRPGDVLRFGDVEALLCTGRILWAAIQAGRAPAGR
jgi:hypothetical protein